MKDQSHVQLNEFDSITQFDSLVLPFRQHFAMVESHIQIHSACGVSLNNCNIRLDSNVDRSKRTEQKEIVFDRIN